MSSKLEKYIAKLFVFPIQFNSKLSNLNLFSEVGLFRSEIPIISRAVDGESYICIQI